MTNEQERETLQSLIECCEAWEPDARILGNVRAGDAAAALRAALASQTQLVRVGEHNGGDYDMRHQTHAAPQVVQEPTQVWIRKDHLQKALRTPFLCDVRPTPAAQDYVPLAAPLAAGEPHTDGVPASEALRTALDLTLTKEEAGGLAGFLDEDTEADEDAVRLLIGDGHSGYGLYAAHPEYPEEGAILVKNLPDPSGVAPTDGGQQ